MKFSDVMIYFNYNMTNVAKALVITKQNVATWKKKGKVPYSWQCQLEILTKGELKANKDD